MDFFASGCSLMRAPYFEQVMTVLGYYGHGSVGGVVVLLLLAHGYVYKNEHTKRAGIALCVALIAAGIAAQALKELIQWPRPKLRTSQGFPSGHTSAAFAMATVLTRAFPVLGPLFYLLAALTGLSRLYFRAHFTWDVAGGAVLGLLAGMISSAMLMRSRPRIGWHPARSVGWATVALFGAAVLGFFHSVERSIQLYILDPREKRTGDAIVASLDFGSPGAREFLRTGWLADEQWFEGKQSVVWATGLSSEATLELPFTRPYRFRLHVFPYAPKGPACQTLEVRLNDRTVTKIFLEQGWHEYELPVPQEFIRSGKNDLRFSYTYAESPKSRGRGADSRSLAVAFDKLEVIAGN